MATNGRAKGKRGELQVAELLRRRGIPARRGVQFSGGPDSPDIAHALDAILHLEVKFHQRMLLDDWYDQAVVDARYRFAVVIHRKAQPGPVRWIATTSLRELAEIMGLPDGHEWGDGSEAGIRLLLSRSVLAPVIVSSNALRFERYYAEAIAGAQPGWIPALVHRKKDEDAIWMVSLPADDLLELAIQYAMERYDWQPTFDSDGFSGELERHYRSFWESQRPQLAKLMPLFSGDNL